MRRFASVFAPNNRRDRVDVPTPPEPQSQPADVEPANKKSIRRAHTLNTGPAASQGSTTPTPSIPPNSDPPPSSGSSSGSASLRTPDDDQLLVVNNARRRKSWIPWLGKKSSSVKVKLQAEEGVEGGVTVVHMRPAEWRSQPVPVLRRPPLGNQIVIGSNDTDEELSESDDSSPPPQLVPSMPANILITPQVTAQSTEVLRTRISNSLQVQPHVPPLLRQPNTPLFPHSCSRFPSTRRRQPTMISLMHQTRLLRRLDETGMLMPADKAVIAFFSVGPTERMLAQPAPFFNECAINPQHLEIFSSGLATWVSRPCFEERFDVWLPEDNTILRRPVLGTKLAVAALEFSESLETMAGMYLVREDQATVENTPSIIHELTPSNEAQANSRSAPYLSIPSPLRIEHSPTSSSPSKASLIIASTAELPSSNPAVAKRGVRFVEQPENEQSLVGYADRLKKRREEKAAFLRDQKEKRALEVERARMEEERRARDKERREWDKERTAWEAEKKAMEEERKQRLYREEVVAARLRRESQRAGTGSGFSSKIGSLTPSTSASSLRNSERNDRELKQRPTYDTRRPSSVPVLPSISTKAASGQSWSPDSSRTPSSAASQQQQSRPPSVYSTHSSDDVRQHANKRNSTHSLHARPASERSQSFGNRSSSSVQVIPPVPAFPVFSVDMPLLPPTPPFMMHQYPRSQNTGSPGSIKSTSASPTRQRAHNNSSERVNVHSRQSTSSSRQSSSQRPESTHSHSANHHQYPSAPSSSSSLHRPDGGHKRHSSGDARISSNLTGRPSPDRGRPPPRSSQTLNHVSRGRTSQPYLQTPSPWTALPTAHGHLPTSMPNSSNMPTHIRPEGSRRQTTIT